MPFNPLNKSKSSSFLFKLHNDLIDVEFYITKTSLPRSILEFNDVKAPSLTYPVPGTLLTFNELPITVMSDEGLEIWLTLDDFLTQSTSRPDIVYTNIEYPKFEAVLYLLTNKGTVFKKIIFHDTYLKEVSPYDLGADDDKIETFTANFVYSYKSVESVDE